MAERSDEAPGVKHFVLNAEPGSFSIGVPTRNADDAPEPQYIQGAHIPSSAVVGGQPTGRIDDIIVSVPPAELHLTGHAVVSGELQGDLTEHGRAGHRRVLETAYRSHVDDWRLEDASNNRQAERAYEELLKEEERKSSIRRALIDTWGVWLPQRIVNEELGDYLEDIDRRIGQGQKWGVRIRIVAAMFWTASNAIGYIMSQALGRWKAG
jgi:hypothetical protein